MVEPPSTPTIFRLPISTTVGIATRVGSGVVVEIARVILGTRPQAIVAAVVVLRALLWAAAAASLARHLSHIAALAGAIDGGLVVLGGA